VFGVLKVPVKFKVSVVLVGKSLKVTIPKELCEHLSIKKGDKVQMWADDHHLIVEKMES
jgi:bifunctional DNA-binding transcriptional regulator/antitoxin component of YhaV-PrlF toxin-antitoxin module